MSATPSIRPRFHIHLVRHGVTEWNRDGLVQGWTDVALSEDGRRQAARLALALRDVPIARIVTSDLGRAVETAEAIVRDRDVAVEKHPELREYHCGEWEGRAYLEIRAHDRERFWAWFNDPETPMPGGESMTTAGRRVAPLLARLLEEMAGRTEGGSLVVVGHGGISRLLAAELLQMPLEVAKRLRLDNASISIFEPFLGGWALKLWNSVSHLDGLDAAEGPTASRVG
jgi:broad specificity phosphatase PhoE